MSVNINRIQYNQLTLEKYKNYVSKNNSNAKHTEHKVEISSKDSSTLQNNNKENKKSKIKKIIKSTLLLAIILLLRRTARRFIDRGNELNNAFIGIRHVINNNPPPPPSGGDTGSNPLRIICPKNNPLFKLAVAIKLTLKGEKIPEVVLPEDEFKKLLAYLKNNTFSSLPENVRTELLFYLNKMPIDLLRKLPENVFKLLPKCQNIPYKIK